MTVGRSEQANTLEVDSERKVRSTVGWVPRVTFLRSRSRPLNGRIHRNTNQTNTPNCWSSTEIVFKLWLNMRREE